MKIAICTTGPDLDSPVENSFGRCTYFILLDENGNHLQSLLNDSKDAAHGAGIAAAQLLINNGVQVVLAGKVGPKALKPLQSAGVQIYTGISGSASQTLENYKAGRLKQLEK